MKIDLYLDVFEGQTPDNLFAMSAPGEKVEGSRRYMISVNIPDYAFFGVVEAAAPIEAITEVDKD